jgi:hypothetical protein
MAVFRLLVSIASTAYSLAVIVATGPANFFSYLTNWGMLIMAITFNMLTFGHIQNGDFCQSKCQ